MECFDSASLLHVLGGLMLPGPVVARSASRFGAGLKIVLGCEGYLERLSATIQDHLRCIGLIKTMILLGGIQNPPF